MYEKYHKKYINKNIIKYDQNKLNTKTTKKYLFVYLQKPQVHKICSISTKIAYREFNTLS